MKNIRIILKSKYMKITNNYLSKFPGGFTVLMSVYENDDPIIFRNSIESVFSNTIKPDAFILVVDGPISSTLDNQIRFFELNSHILVLRLENNQGLANALNLGLSHVKTEWVVRADADDFNLPDRFLLMANYLINNPNVDIFGSHIAEINEIGHFTGLRCVPIQHEDIVLFAKSRCPFNHMTVAYRLSKINQIGGYSDLYNKQDYFTWIKFIANGARCGNIDAVLVNAFAGKAMIKRRGGIKYAFAEIALQRKLVKFGFNSIIESLFYGSLRICIFLLPHFLRSFFYKFFLRTSQSILKK
jgi:glycosyltransferase involved in cell wall biosynthesis